MLQADGDDDDRLKKKIVAKFLRNDIINGRQMSIRHAQDLFRESEQPDIRTILRDQRRTGDDQFPVEAEESGSEVMVYVPSDRVAEAFDFARSNEGLSGGGMNDS